MKRILFINGGLMCRGGIESFMMNYYRHFDRTKLQIDFVVHGFGKGYYDDEIESMGGKIYNIPVKSVDYKGNIKALNKILATNEYQIVHSHMDAMGYIPLKVAKEHKIPFRIAHSHNTNHLTNNPLKRILNEYARYAVRKYATHFFACSEIAGEWLFGKSIVKSDNYTVIHNAIAVEKYLFNSEVRDDFRKKLNIDKNLVIGHVGRFDYQKNHEFLIDVFSEVSKKEKDAILILIGEGKLMPAIKEKVNRLMLTDKVLFEGSRSDVNLFLNCFDLMAVTSHFEGLCIAAIEGQANGLSVISADTIPAEANVAGLIKYKSLTDSPKEWAEEILKTSPTRDENVKDKIIEKGYDIEVEALKLQEFYLNLLS